MPRKNDGLTPRQRQSQQIMRAKTAMKKRKALVRKCSIIGGSGFAVIIVAGGIWGWKSGMAAKAVQSAENSAYGLTVKAGFSLESMYLEGRNRTSQDEIDRALNMKQGDPILKMSLDDMRERLEKVESIKFASVERALPSSLYVRIVEREPVALWQNSGKLALVDDNGVVMNDIDIAPYKQLPLIIGDSAPKHVRELMSIMSAEPELAKRFSSAIRVSDRRWNIRLSGEKGQSVEVRLPELNPVAAWKKLAEIEQKQRILDREVKVIDLRLDGKVFIKLSPDVFSDKPDTARET
jgi:cell division protein FtsQ